ncbi:MAG: hypothetical protein R2714_07930 [Microthrixaceae bacterium]
MTKPTHPEAGRGRTRRRGFLIAAITVVLALVAVACSDDDGGDDTTTTTTSTTTSSTTTTTIVGETVEYSFDEPIDESEAEQAASTMTRRLEAAGATGSTVVVNSAGTGLEITVAGTTTAAEASEIVEPLTVEGALYFRPVLEALAPTPTDPPSQYTDAALGLPTEGDAEPTTTVAGETTTTAVPTTLPGADVATTPPEADDPNGVSVLPQYDDQGGVVQRFRVGPQQLTGSAIAGAEKTEYSGYNAVKMQLNEGADGIDGFNALAAQCNPPTDTCPVSGPGGVGRIAIVLDSVVDGAPSIRPDEAFRPFSASGIYLYAPWLTEQGAEQLAIVLEIGALPVGLTLV